MLRERHEEKENTSNVRPSGQRPTFNIEALGCDRDRRDRFALADFTSRSPCEFVPGTGWSPGLEANLLSEQTDSYRLVPFGLGTLNRSMHMIVLNRCIQCPDTIHEL